MVEDDPTGPTGVYGQSKLEGEQAIRAALPDDHVIARTAWVYSYTGANFVKTMLRLAEGRDTLTIVDDQFGNPTCAADIADGVLHIIGQSRAEDPRRGLGQTYHLAGSGETNWHGFASYIFAQSAALAALSSLYKELADKQLVPLNPVSGVKRPKSGDGGIGSGKTPAITKQLVRAMLDTPDTSTLKGLRDRAILHILFFMGARISEPAKLRIRDFRMDTDY